MSNEHLRHTLDELHHDLEASDLDAEDMGLLRDALHDIIGRLDQAGEPLMPSATDVIDDYSVRFAEQHPTLAAGLRRLIQLLNQSGL